MGAVGAGALMAILLILALAIGRTSAGRTAKAVGYAAFTAGAMIAGLSFGAWQNWWIAALLLVGSASALVLSDPRILLQKGPTGHARN